MFFSVLWMIPEILIILAAYRYWQRSKESSAWIMIVSQLLLILGNLLRLIPPLQIATLLLTLSITGGLGFAIGFYMFINRLLGVQPDPSNLIIEEDSMNITSEPTSPKKQAFHYLLYAFLAFLGLGGLFSIGIVAFSEFDEFEIKILVTTFSIALTSLCVMSSSLFVKHKQLQLVAYSGIVLAVLGSILLLTGMWIEISEDHYWTSSLIITVYAIAIAHFLALRHVRLAQSYQWLFSTTAGTLFLLASFISAVLTEHYDFDDMWRFIAMLSVLAAIETLAIPILSKLHRKQEIQKP